VLGRVVQVVVDAHDDGGVLVLGGRGRDDDLLGATVDVALALVASVKKPVDSMTMSSAHVAQSSFGRVASRRRS
jgi:hypothetical protein